MCYSHEYNNNNKMFESHIQTLSNSTQPALQKNYIKYCFTVILRKTISHMEKIFSTFPHPLFVFDFY